MKRTFSPAHAFQELIRLAASTDWYEDLCSTCHRVTRWAHSGTVAGRKYYTCAGCGTHRSQRQP
jgi:hypothetical protein